MLKYVGKTYKPDLMLVGFPGTDEVQHQFLGLVSPTVPGGKANPAYDDVNLDGVKDNRVAAAQGVPPRFAYAEADHVLTIARGLVGKDPTTFVSSDHGFAPQFLAIDASKVLKDLDLLSNVQTSNCRTATGETIALAKACWAGGTLQVYLKVEGRDCTTPTGQPACGIKAADVSARVTQIRDGVQGHHRPHRLEPRRLARRDEGHRPDVHQGRGPLHPQRPELDGRHGPPDPDRRPRRVLLPAVPVRRRDARAR